jgi:hypothetical protein
MRVPNKNRELIGDIGSPISNFWEWTHTFEVPLSRNTNASWALPEESDQVTTVTENICKLE